MLKNAIDWAARPYSDSAWPGKPAAIMSASTGRIGTARVQYNLRQVMVGGANECFDTVGNLTDEQTREYVYRLVQSLVDWTQRIGIKGEADGYERRVARR